MNRLRTTVQCAAFLGAVLLASTAAAEQLDETWVEVSIGGIPVGYVHETVQRADDGTLVTEAVSDFSVRRGGDLVTIRGTDKWVETAERLPLSYEQTRKLTERTQEISATVSGDRLSFRKTDGNDTSFSSADWEGTLLFPRGLDALHSREAGPAGTQYSYATFDPDLEDVAVFNVTLVGPETVEILGEPRGLTKLRIVSDSYDDVVFFEWRDADGKLWKAETPATEMSYVRSTPEIVNRERVAADILLESMIPTNANVARPYEVDDALYEIWMDEEDVSSHVVEDGRQSIEGTTERGILLRVKRVVPELGTTINFPVRSTPLKDYLDGNPMMQTWYPLILGAGAQAVWGSEQDSWHGAEQIEEWVFTKVSGKERGTGFASAREVLELMSGDSSEHAILMAAMTRAVSIPTRLVSGLMHYDGEFGYHVWVEVWTGEDWFALDPTTGLGSVDAMHIKLADSSLPGGSIAELSLGILKTYERLNVRIVEYTRDGETVRP